jgi:hypothetical protein
VKLEWLDPYRLFASRVWISRHAIKIAYDEAFAAFQRCHALLKEELWAEFPGGTSDWFHAMANAENQPEPARDRINDLHYTAEVENNLADWQAAIVLMFADETLQRFARGVLGRSHRAFDGYGPQYPDATNCGRPVRLTTLLRAGTNAIRHVAEWDTPEFPFPYPTVPHCNRPRCSVCQAMYSIDVIQRVFGIGIHERIRDAVSMRVLICVDGQLGTAAPDYTRLEEALLSAASEIAHKASPAASTYLKGALKSVSLS